MGDVPGHVNEGPWKLVGEATQPTEPEETEPTEPEPTETEPTEPTKTEPEETETTEPVETFPVGGSANYDLGMIRDVLFVPNGIDTAYEEENYVLTGYINNINTQYIQVLAEYGNSGAYTSVYEYGTQRTSMYQNEQVYSYEYDGRGSVSELVNAIGDTQIKYSYGAYGETVSAVIGWNNPVTNPYRYNAERIDDVAGVPAFQYLRARYLNPYTSTFLTQDSYLGQLTSPLSQNRYTYAHNNPLNYVDPSGHFILTALIVGAVVGAVAGAVVGGVTSAISQKQETGEVSWGKVFKDAAIGGVAGTVGGSVGAAIAVALPAAVGATTITGAVSLTLSQSIGVGMASAVGGGIYSRYVSSNLHNAFSPERPKANPVKEAFNAKSMLVDGVIGGFGGALTHWANSGIYQTETSIERQQQMAQRQGTDSNCEAMDDLIDGIDDAASNPNTAQVTSSAGAEGRTISLEHQAISGVELTSTPDKTTTILGRYQQDTKYIIEELELPKSTDFGGNPGGFNLLNTPDDLYAQLGADGFWNEYNKPFLDAAIARGDEILMATTINPSTLYGSDGSLTGYGREFYYLISKGYEYVDGKMIFTGGK